MDGTDLAILRQVQDGILLEEKPFARIAETLLLDEAEVVGRLERLKQSGIIRRFGSRINPRQAGIAVNVMVVWKVPPDRIAEVGRTMAGFPEVTHCYERRIHPGRWEYNLYTVLHGCDRAEVLGQVERLSRRTGIGEYAVLTSTEEFKRTPPGRISEEP